MLNILHNFHGFHSQNHGRKTVICSDGTAHVCTR